MSEASLLEQRVEEHRAEGWGQGKCQGCFHAVAMPAFQLLQQRDVSLEDGFEQPVFLEKPFMLGMPHERQMSVED